MGISLRDHPGDTAATLIPSAGCPIGCNFCSTSAMFGGKGNSVEFYKSGDELFEIMCQLEESLDVKAFFVMDENFLVNRPRASGCWIKCSSTTNLGRSICLARRMS